MTALTSEFPLKKKRAYFNTAGVGLMPRTVVEQVSAMYGRYLSTPPYEELFQEFRETVERARGEFARVIGAKEEEVSFQSNASTGLNLAVQMVNPKSGENVVSDDLAFPSDVYPLLAMKRRKVGVKIIPSRRGLITPGDYAGEINSKTRLVMLSYVSWVNGLRLDGVEEIVRTAHENGAYVMIDTTQATGCLDVDVRRWNVDFLTTSNYKWLLSPFGAAEFYCRADLFDRFEPPHVGWNSVGGGPRELKVEEYTLARSGKRFEAGNPDYVAVYGMTRSLRVLSRFGRSKIRRETLAMTREVIEGSSRLGMEILSPHEENYLSGIVYMRSRERSGASLAAYLAKRGVLVSDRYFHGISGIRVSPFFYNDSAEVERFLASLKRALA